MRSFLGSGFVWCVCDLLAGLVVGWFDGLVLGCVVLFVGGFGLVWWWFWWLQFWWWVFLQVEDFAWFPGWFGIVRGLV